MLSFLMGFGAVAAAMANGPEVRRAIARLVLVGSELATETGRVVCRASTQLAEDFEDTFAEVAAERKVGRSDADVLASVQQLRQEIDALRAQLAKRER